MIVVLFFLNPWLWVHSLFICRLSPSQKEELSQFNKIQKLTLEFGPEFLYLKY